MESTAIKKSDEIDAQTKFQIIDGEPSETKTIVSDSTILDLLDISTNEPTETDCLLDIFSNSGNSCRTNNASAQSSSNLLTFDFLKKIHGSTAAAAAASAASSCIPSSTASMSLSSSSSSSLSDANKGKSLINKSKMSDKKASAWMDLFADLDPLSNPTAMEKKIAGLNQNCLDA